MSNKQNKQGQKAHTPQVQSNDGQAVGNSAADDQTGESCNMEELQNQLASVTAERDTLAAQLAEATSKLQAAAAPAKSGNEGKGTHVRVCSKSPAGSHRRAGRLWTAEPVDVLLKDLTNEQLAQLRSCPLTIVVDL
jgi:hypothetical protein